MFIVLVGTRSAGKSTIQDYLVAKHGFKVVTVSTDSATDQQEGASYLDHWDDSSSCRSDADSDILPPPGIRESFLSMNVYSPITPHPPLQSNSRPMSMQLGATFATHEDMLSYLTQNWRINFVTSDLENLHVLEEFAIRPFLMVVYVDAPVLRRFERSKLTDPSLLLESFVAADDQRTYGRNSRESQAVDDRSSLQSLQSLVHLRVINDFDSVEAFHAHLDTVDLTNQERLRPGWDTYFMRLASLASLRSNCMKRRVGAILVRNKRIVATGYNGTARGLTNCNEGGCPRCSGSSASGTALDECVCLHAEENALLEAGRERIGEGAVLYCNTCPCLRCTVKIIQIGVQEVVYNLGYRVDDASAALFREAGVHLRRHAPPS